MIYLAHGSAGCALANELHAIAIVVDALRASTTVAALFDHGAARVLVVASLEDTCALGLVVPDALLVGERQCLPPEGFHLGNSPCDVLAGPRMDGRTVLFTSSNGAQRLTACRDAAVVAMGTLANASAVAAWADALARETGRDIVFIGAGKYPDERYISPEDEAAAVYIAAKIDQPLAEDAQQIFGRWQEAIATRGLLDIFRDSPHAAILLDNGLEEDLACCATPDILHSVPVVTAPVEFAGRVVGVEVRGAPV
jgi:2-phosphosulfolactate phosphatase